MFKEIRISGTGTKDFQILFDGKRIPQIDQCILDGTVNVEVEVATRYAILHLGLPAQNVVVENPEWQTIHVDPPQPKSQDSPVSS